MKNLIIILIAIFYASTSYAQKITYSPKNELYQDSSLVDFISKFQYAIIKKDTSFLFAALDDQVYHSFDGSIGKDYFIESWNLKSKDSDLWIYISKVISLGMVFSEADDQPNTAIFPSLFIENIPETMDYYNACFITAPIVNVREKPDVSSKIVGKLGFEIVEVFPNEEGVFTFQSNEIPFSFSQRWYRIKTLDSKIVGYVNCEYAYLPLDIRMFLSKKDGRWKITALLAGD